MSDWALQILGLHLRLSGTDILRGVSLDVAPGERLGIIGPNGAGKSSLFHLISGRMAPSSGQVWLHGRRIDGLSVQAISRLGLARSFQITNLFPRLSVRDNLRCALLWRLGHRRTFWRALEGLRDVQAELAQWLEHLQLEARAEVPAGQLSYAEQRILELGLTLAGGASVVLLDEPTAGLNPSEARHMTRLIQALTPGRTLLVIEHDMQVVAALADRIAVLQAGAWLACDSPARIQADPRVQAAYLGSAKGSAA